MIEYAIPAGSNVVEVTVGGHISKEEVERTYDRFSADIADGKTRILENIGVLDGIAPAALWEDLRRGLPMFNKVTHVAIVADQTWIKAVTGFARLFTSAEVRTFDRTDLETARAWLRGA